MAENLANIIGVELLVAAQGVEFRAPLETSKALAKVIARLREDVAPLGDDRVLAPDMAAATRLVHTESMVMSVEPAALPNL
jgi:histidine ammonia-lyase